MLRALGLDASTQSLTGVVIDLEASQVVQRASLDFDADLPAYGTSGGVLGGGEPGVVHAPPLMWVEALDRLCDELATVTGLGAVQAVSLAAQQHGSVYLRRSAAATFAALDPERPLHESLRSVFSRTTAPVWMDSSTGLECREIRGALGGTEAAVALTGSDTFERFTGPQIRRFWKSEPAAYEETAHVALVSSFLTSLLAGRLAPIDHGDGSGMNLMDLGRRDWSPAALAATAPDLARRLPPLVAPWERVGAIAPYFVARYGFDPATLVVAGSGDNPSSAVGVGLVEPGPLVASLGTSDTCFALLARGRRDPDGLGHVFVAPTGHAMALICFHNGALARERVRDRYGLDWRGFSQALRETPPGNGGRYLLPYFEPEIVPRVERPGVHRFGGLDEGEAAANCRAVVEAQMLSMRLHSQWICGRPTTVLATGGGAENREILEIMASVFRCPVSRFEIADGAALGAALRAAHGALRARGEERPWAEVVAELTRPVAGSNVDPDPQAVAVYDRALRRYAELERSVRRS